MTKKEYILKLLDVLWPSRNIAPGLTLLIREWYMAEPLIDNLAKIFQQSIDESNDLSQRNILIKGQKFIQRLREIEKKQQTDEDKDLEELLHTF